MDSYLMGALLFSVFFYSDALQHDVNTLGFAKLAEASVPTTTSSPAITSAPGHRSPHWMVDEDEVWDMFIDYQLHGWQALHRPSAHNRTSTVDASSLHKSKNNIGVSASLRSSIYKPHKVKLEAAVQHKVQHVNSPPIPARRFFFTHHKTGTRLCRGIGGDLGDVLNEQFIVVGPGDWHCSSAGSSWSPCSKHGVVEFANMDAQSYNNLKAECGNFKAVHFVREAGALVVSGYLYHSHSHDTIPGTGPEQLANKPMKEGLLIEARAEVNNTLPEMVDLHNEIRNDPRILTIGLEETQRDFDGTMRKIFTFMLEDTDHQDATDHLVDRARRFDIERWSKEEREQTEHIADPATTHAAIQAFHQMGSEGNELVQQVYSFDPPLGYEKADQL